MAGLDKVRILMGAETTHWTRKAILGAVRAQALDRLDESIEEDKEPNPFLHGVPAILAALRSGQIECRVYGKDKFHAKAYITHAKLEVVGVQALVGSSNFTRPGSHEEHRAERTDPERPRGRAAPGVVRDALERGERGHRGSHRDDSRVSTFSTPRGWPTMTSTGTRSASCSAYRRRSEEVDEMMVEAYVSGVSQRKMGDVTEALLGERVGRSTVSRVAKRLDGAVEALRSAPIEGPHPYLYLDATFLDARWARKVENVSALVAYAVDPDGHRRLLAITLGPEESEDSWSHPAVTARATGSGGDCPVPQARSR